MTLPQLQRLLEVIARLRAPDGCPWDRQQTAQSMAPHLLEETHEAIVAIERGEPGNTCEELGDVLVNVWLIAQISSDAGAFTAEDLARVAADKLVRRHPHVFGEVKVDGVEAAFRNWERIKQEEPARPGAEKGVLAGVPSSLPALLAASRISEKAARVGFDWPDRHGPRAKVAEELDELDEAVAGGDQEAISHELGDLLFSIANFARHVGINPEMALRGTNDRFRRRFACVESELGPDLTGRSLDEMEAAWQRAKLAE